MATTPQIKRALDRFETDLSNRKNVVGLGIVPEKEEGKSSGKMAVGVYVTKKVDPKKLSPKDLLPKSLKIRGRAGAVKIPIRVIEQGKVELEPVGRG
jgi:hypothetical protein